MTTYNNTVFVTNSTSPGNQYTRNVATGDTITVTTNSLGGTVNAVPSNCSVNGSTGTTNGIANGGTCSVTNFTSSSYSILFTSTTNGTNFTFATLSGTVSAGITAPVVNNSQSFASTASSSTSCIVSLTSSGSGGTLQYNKSTSTTVPTSGWQSSSTITGLTRGTAYYLWARRGVGFEDRTNSAISVPYLAPDSSISSIASPNLAYGSTTHTVSIANGNASDQYYVYNNAGTVSYGGRTGNGNITITHGVAAGGAATFRVFARRPVTLGGDNAFDDTGTTFEIEVYPNNVTLSASNNNPSAASVTTTLSVTGGEGGTIEYAKTSYSSTNTYAQTRGTTVTYYARSVGSNGLISQVSFVSHSVGYIAPDAAITLNPTALTLTVGTTQWTVTVSGGSSLDTYQIRDSSGTEHESRNGNGDITVTDVPTTQEVYTAYAKRSTANGGDNTYIDTGKTITITMGTGGIQAPVISSIGIVDIDGTNATATVNLSANGSGGTLKYRQHTTSTPPATGWQTSNSFIQPYSTTRYYFASQDEDTSAAYDTEIKTLGAYNPGSSIYGMQVFNAAENLTLDTTYRVPGVVVIGSSSVNSGTTAVGTPSTYTGTSGNISFPGMTPTNSSEFEVWILDNIPAAGAWSTNQFTINRGTNLFTVTFRTDTSNYTLNFDYIGMRF